MDSPYFLITEKLYEKIFGNKQPTLYYMALLLPAAWIFLAWASALSYAGFKFYVGVLAHVLQA